MSYPHSNIWCRTKNIEVCICPDSYQDAYSRAFYIAVDANEWQRKTSSIISKIYCTYISKYLRLNRPDLLKLCNVGAANKEHESRQRDSLPFELLKNKLYNKSWTIFIIIL